MTPGSSSKRRLAGHEHVERGVAQQVEREGQPVGRRAPRAPGRGDRPDLAGADRQAALVERAAQREPDLVVAVPAQLEHRALGREQLERALQAGGGRARVHDQVALAGGVLRPREAGAERGRDLGPRLVDVDERDLDRREAGEQPRHAAADHPGADDCDPVADERRGVPQGVDGGLDGAGEHGARGRHVVGHDGHGARRHHVGRLVRKQAEDRAPAQLRRPLLDGADVQVAVLDRPGEVAFLERRAWRHPAAERQRLGAAADAGAQRADHDVAAPGLGQRDAPDLPSPGLAEPIRVCVIEHVSCLGFVRHHL